MSFISRSLNFFAIFYCTFLHGMSENEQNSQNIDQSENPRRRPRTSRSTPIACRVCDRIFFDNVSLVLHFECHLEDDEIPTPWLHTKTPPSSQTDQKPPSLNPAKNTKTPPSSQTEKKPPSLNPPKIYGSSLERARRIKVPKTSGLSRPSSLPIHSGKTDVLMTDAGLVEIPVLNSMPPLSPSFDDRRKLSMKQKISTSSLRQVLYHPRARRVANGLPAIPLLQLNKQNGEKPSFKKPQIRQLEMPCRDVIIISDDDDDDNASPRGMLDLTLRL